MKYFIKDCITLTIRNIKLSFRNIDAMIMSLMMPAMMMIVFVFLFGGALDIEGQFGGMPYVNYIISAVVILTICQSSMSTAIIVSNDIHMGMVDRIRSIAISKSAFLIGHVLTSVLRNIVSTIIVFGIAFAIGFRTDAGLSEWLLIICILITFMFIMAWISVLIALISKSVEAASGYMMVFFFLPYLSSGFVPTSTMPVILRQISEFQPMTPIINTLRSLFFDTDTQMWLPTIIWSASLLLLSYILSLVIFSKQAK